MKTLFLFRFGSIQPDALLPQVCKALQFCTEQTSRQRFPRLWKLTDLLNGHKKSGSSASRRKFRLAFSLVLWVLGLLLLVPFLYDPEGLPVLGLTGGAAFALSMLILWKNQRVVLALCGLVTGGILSVGSMGGSSEPFTLMILGLILLGVGIAAFLTRGHKKKERFQESAVQLLNIRSSMPKGADVRVIFTEESMNIHDQYDIPYKEIHAVLESKDLFFVLFEKRIFILQKKELRGQPLDAFRNFIQEKSKLLSVED